MKSRISILLLSILLMLSLASCASQKGADEPSAPEDLNVESPYTVIEHKNTMLGGPIPDWTYTAIGALEGESRFEGKYLYKFERVGKDLSGVRALADTFDAASTIAQEVNFRVQQKFAGAEVGDGDFVETYFENVVKVLADARISGFRKYDDFWIYRTNNTTGENEYIYYSLYTIDKDEVDRLIEEAITNQPAETDEEQTAQERVREIFESGL